MQTKDRIPFCFFVEMQELKRQMSESNTNYEDRILHAKHYGKLYLKRKGRLGKKTVDEYYAVACIVCMPWSYEYD